MSSVDAVLISLADESKQLFTGDDSDQCVTKFIAELHHAQMKNDQEKFNRYQNTEQLFNAMLFEKNPEPSKQSEMRQLLLDYHQLITTVEQKNDQEVKYDDEIDTDQSGLAPYVSNTHFKDIRKVFDSLPQGATRAVVNTVSVMAGGKETIYSKSISEKPSQQKIAERCTLWETVKKVAYEDSLRLIHDRLRPRYKQMQFRSEYCKLTAITEVMLSIQFKKSNGPIVALLAATAIKHLTDLKNWMHGEKNKSFDDSDFTRVDRLVAYLSKVEIKSHSMFTV